MKMKYLSFAIVLLALAPAIFAQEAISLTVPLAPKPAIASYTPGVLNIDFNAVAPRITITLVATDGTTQTFSYPCAPGCAFDTSAKVTTLITTLNTANLSTRSLWRRIMDRLILDFSAQFSGGATVQ